MTRFCLALGAAFVLVSPGHTQEATSQPLKGAVIVVDPGHGGQAYSKSYTGGTRGVSSRVFEGELNLKVAVELAKGLRGHGATVFLTRDADHRLSPEGSSGADELHARIDFFEHHNCHFFLSVHHNAGAATATGHTALYKHNAKDDTLYEAIAADVNTALEGAVPGPKQKLIKGSYHILRETAIPGTISEAGYLTNRDFDERSNRPGYAETEAAAIARGAVKYWTEHKDELTALRDRLARERAANPRDPKSLTASALNPDHQLRMKQLVEAVAPEGTVDPAKAQKYVDAFRRISVKDAATFDVKAEHVDGRIKLTGEVSDRKDHDRLIDLFVAMKLYSLTNDIQFPKAKP